MTVEPFAGFEAHTIDTDGASIFCRKGGSGPPLVLLHGYPQTHMCWHRVAPVLAEHFTVIAPDLRGYGRSSIPESDPGHLPYSKRAMATDVIDVMEAFGYQSFRVVGHDRGGRVAYRMAFDFADAVDRVATLDIVPTLATWDAFDAKTALSTYHWTFLAQPYPMPERLIENDAIAYLHHTLASWTSTGDLSAFAPDALKDYETAFTAPGRLHAMCEDYRAGATIDRLIDAEDQDAGRRIKPPFLVLWGDRGLAHDGHATVRTWERWAEQVEGRPIACGHFLPEEASDEVVDALIPFMRR